MILYKYGENISFSIEDIKSPEIIAADKEVYDRFVKIATDLKKIAPKADDFLYFSAIMMHAAERCLIDDNGDLLKNADGSPLEAHWDINEKTGAWKWVCSDESVKVYKNCFVPYTQVLMADGTMKNIQDIVVDDYVITHTGKSQKVLKTFITPHCGTLSKISVRNGRDIICTDNHPFYRLTCDNIFAKKTGSKQRNQKHILRIKSSLKTFEFVECKNLNKFDLLLSPVLKEKSGCNLTEAQARLLGLFAAEGSYSKKYNKYQGALFTFNINEIDTLALDVEKLAKASFENCSVHINKTEKSTCYVSITGKGVVDFFRYHVGEYSEHKTLSKDLVFGPNNIKKQFLIGWLEGDGHVGKDYGQLIGITISKNLVSQVRIMLNSCHINHSLRFIESTNLLKNINPKYNSFISKDSYRIEIPATAGEELVKLSNKLNFTNRGKIKKQNCYYENYALHSINNIDFVEYEGNVYNLEVENDNSYVVNDIIVHNCNGDIFPEAELKKAYKKWIGKPLCKDHQSSSVDGIRGMIIDTYWDEKYKRIIALCALDKVNYPDLARKIATGYANDVSMGVGVGRSICYDCGNVAKTEQDYCNCVRTRKAYGEINTELNPIELSVVVNGADKKAKILGVLAAAQRIEDIIKTSNVSNIPNLQEQFEKLSIRVSELENEILIGKPNNNVTLRKAANISDDNDKSEISLLTIRNKMSSIEDMLKVIATKISTEDLMKTKTAYWQGTEEPTPGKTQYQKEEADKIRNEQDSHMKTQLTDLGPVDGLPKQDLEAKKLHARATIEERRALRAAAVEKAKQSIKTAYPQGTEEKTTYPADPGAKVRETEFEFNKGPVGAKDEATKEKLSRASLKAKFVKSSSGKAGDNKWEVVAGETVVFAASLDELTGKKPVLYSSVATKEFAQQMMKNIRSLGAEKAASLYKSAQEEVPAVEEMPAPEAAPEALTEAPAAPEGMEMPVEPEEDFKVDIDAVKSGLTEVDELIQNVLEKMEPGKDALKEEATSFSPEQLSTAKANPELVVEAALADLTSEQPKEATQSLNQLRVVLNAGLTKSFGKNIKNLKASKEEVGLLLTALSNKKSDSQFLAGLANQAIADANKAVKKAKALQMAFVKYAKGSDQLEKQAQMESEMSKTAQAAPVMATSGEKEEDKKEDVKEDAKKDVSTASEEFDLTTTAGRKQYREKLAASVASKMKNSDMLNKAHPKGSAPLAGVAGTKEALVEDLEGVQSKMMEAVSHEPKVKKAAESLEKLIKAGKVSVDNLDEMVSHGLDKSVVDYWKKYYSQADGGSEFAAGLTKEYSAAKTEQKKAEDSEAFSAKLVKSYDLAYEMADAGLISKTRDSIRKQAEEIVAYDDAAYKSMQRVVEHHARVAKKTASSAVQVGIALDKQASDESTSSSLYDELVSVLSDGKSFKF